MPDEDPNAVEPKPDEAILAKLNALEQTLVSEREARHALEVKLATKPEPKREISRIELNAMVEDGKISESQRDDILDQQREERLTGKITEQIAAVSASEQQNAQLLSLIDRYKETYPELMTEGEARQRMVQEVVYQAQLQGRTEATRADEAAALRAVYGPVESLQAGRTPKPTHEEVGADTEDPDQESEGGKFSKRELDYGRRLVALGIKKDLDEFKKTVKTHGNPVLRRKYGARI